MKNTHSKLCPSCNDILIYHSKSSLNRSIKKNSKCLSCAMTGRVVSEETRIKKSVAFKGITPSKKCQEAAWAANRGSKRTPEHMRAIIEGNYKKVVSEEARDLIGKAHKGKIVSEESRKKMSIAHTGKVISEETKLNMSKAQTGKVHGPMSEEQKNLISIMNSGRKHSKESRKNMLIAQRERYGRPMDWNPPYTTGQLRTWGNHAKEKTPFCEWCYSEDKLRAHHILPKWKFPQYALDYTNARVLCEECHKTCHRQGGF